MSVSKFPDINLTGSRAPLYSSKQKPRQNARVIGLDPRRGLLATRTQSQPFSQSKTSDDRGNKPTLPKASQQRLYPDRVDRSRRTTRTAAEDPEPRKGATGAPQPPVPVHKKLVLQARLEAVPQRKGSCPKIQNVGLDIQRAESPTKRNKPPSAVRNAKDARALKQLEPLPEVKAARSAMNARAAARERARQKAAAAAAAAAAAKTNNSPVVSKSTPKAKAKEKDLSIEVANAQSAPQLPPDLLPRRPRSRASRVNSPAVPGLDKKHSSSKIPAPTPRSTTSAEATGKQDRGRPRTPHTSRTNDSSKGRTRIPRPVKSIGRYNSPANPPKGDVSPRRRLMPRPATAHGTTQYSSPKDHSPVRPSRSVSRIPRPVKRTEDGSSRPARSRAPSRASSARSGSSGCLIPRPTKMKCIMNGKVSKPYV